MKSVPLLAQEERVSTGCLTKHESLKVFRVFLQQRKIKRSLWHSKIDFKLKYISVKDFSNK